MCHSGKARHIDRCQCFIEKENKMSNTIDQQVVGMDTQAAVAKIAEAGFVPRITNEDGKAFVLTFDFNANRLNLVVVSGKIVSVSRG